MFDVQAARQAGYSDDEIATFLSHAHPEFNVQGARQSGYSLDEIGNELNNPQQKQTAQQQSQEWEGPGLQDVTLNLPRTFDGAGQAAAEAMGAAGHPIAGATVGTGIQMIPTLLENSVGGKALESAMPAANAVGRGVANLQEGFTGVPASDYQAVANNPSILLAPGRKAVSEGYQASKELAGGIDDALTELQSPREMIQKALDLGEKNNLTPAEALEARKELDMAKDSFSNLGYQNARQKLDSVAKMAFGGDDAAYQQALTAERLRNVAPLNMSGKPSIMRIAGAMASKVPILGGAISPIVNAGADALVGGAAGLAEQNPHTAMAIGQAVLDAYQRATAKRSK